MLVYKGGESRVVLQRRRVCVSVWQQQTLETISQVQYLDTRIRCVSTWIRGYAASASTRIRGYARQLLWIRHVDFTQAGSELTASSRFPPSWSLLLEGLRAST
eukprot:329768-Rhodomonas_salina.3